MLKNIFWKFKNNRHIKTDENTSPKYVIFWKSTSFVPYYYIEGKQTEEEAVEAPRRGDKEFGLYYDPIEDTILYRTVCPLVEKRIEELRKGEPWQRGSVYGYFIQKKKLLKEYGIDWHSPKEMNPGCCID